MLPFRKKSFLRISSFFLLSLIFPAFAFAEKEEADSIQRYQLDEIVVSTSRETRPFQLLPVSTSVLFDHSLELLQIQTPKDIGDVVPNLHIPAYGSAMTSAIYLRGIGARGNGQSSVGLYVDNVPYLDKSSYDFELMDIDRIEVLRGPQSTLYGRNTMGGIIHIHRRSAFAKDELSASLSTGRFGDNTGNVLFSKKINDANALSAGISTHSFRGYRRNLYTGEYADNSMESTVFLRGETRKNSGRWVFDLNANFTNQNAFPYGLYNPQTGDVADVNHDGDNTYQRSMINGNIMYEKKNDRILFISTTGLHWLSDDMNMDQDYTPQRLFLLNQVQNEYSISQEFSLKNRNKSRIDWSLGAMGFYQYLKTDATVTFLEDGISTILQPVFDTVAKKGGPTMIITDKNIPIPGTYKTPSAGIALYGQATLKDLFIPKLSLTGGVRIGYEFVDIDYSTAMTIGMRYYQQGMRDTIWVNPTYQLEGKEKQASPNILPKAALQYDFDDFNSVYFSVSSGYKSGGYNIQMFADLIQQMARNNPVDVDAAISYKPEFCVAYEIGTKNSFFNHKLHTQAAYFYNDITNMQITQFVTSTQGRKTSNAGAAVTQGIELSLSARLNSSWMLTASYGYTNAKFTEFNSAIKINGRDTNINYKGNRVPYVPENTFSAGLTYSTDFVNSTFVKTLTAHAQFTGSGKTYWDEANTLSQDFIGTLNANVTLDFRKNFSVGIWCKNMLNTTYNTFVFVSGNKAFGQQALPFQIGVNAAVKIGI